VLLSRLLKIALIVIVLADTVFLLAVKTPARLYALSAMGRSACPLPETLQGFENAKRQRTFFVQFQHRVRVIERDPAGYELWETPRGRWWMPQGDQILPFLLAEQESRIYGTGDRGVHPGDLVLDCGANVGTFVKTALESGAEMVVAIEPAPQTLECLRRNLAPEIAAHRVIIYPKGVWDKDDFLTLSVDEHNVGSNSLVIDTQRAKSVRVPLTTIDKLVAELKLGRVDFIKMDIEGAEKNALAGGRETIQHFHPRMSISSEHLPDDVQKIPEVVRGIRAEYHVEYADCQDQGSRVTPLVLQFF
jgi:FkbM family methyltransferase